jgi:large subunit ribosomal protein L25
MSLLIKSEIRESFGKNASRRIRREGNVPAVMYGAGDEGVSLILNKKDIFSVLKSETGENTILKVTLDKKTSDVMIKDLQIDPVSDELLHVDLIQIAMDKEIRVTVNIILTGESIGVKTEGGFVDFITREVEMECLPKDIPEHIEVDISDLHLNQSIKVEEITPPPGSKITSDLHAVIALIQAPKTEEVAEVEEEEVIPEGEEPEVIAKEEAPAESKEEEKE